MLGDIVKDWVSGQEFVVTWDGGNRATLLDYDARLTAQRLGARDHMTSGATMTIDLRRGGSIYKGSI